MVGSWVLRESAQCSSNGTPFWQSEDELYASKITVLVPPPVFRVSSIHMMINDDYIVVCNELYIIQWLFLKIEISVLFLSCPVPFRDDFHQLSMSSSWGKNSHWSLRWKLRVSWWNRSVAAVALGWILQVRNSLSPQQWIEYRHRRYFWRMLLNIWVVAITSNDLLKRCKEPKKWCQKRKGRWLFRTISYHVIWRFPKMVGIQRIVHYESSIHRTIWGIPWILCIWGAPNSLAIHD